LWHKFIDNLFIQLHPLIQLPRDVFSQNIGIAHMFKFQLHSLRVELLPSGGLPQKADAAHPNESALIVPHLPQVTVVVTCGRELKGRTVDVADVCVAGNVLAKSRRQSPAAG
jgi:hypothetical protein